MFTDSKVEWAIDTLEPFKSPGLDGIYPVLIQKCKSVTVPALVKLFKASFLLRHIPAPWRQVRVVFIPKANKKDKASPKSYRPISLSSVFLKIMEKIIDEHIKSEVLSKTKMSSAQFAYQPGKSTVTALHTLVGKIEKSFEAKEVLMAAFIDIEGAFDNASYKSMQRAMRKRGFDESIIKWIMKMLSKREISSDLGDSKIKVTAVKGCPQGGVLSPLLWTLVVDELLTNLESLGFEVIGFADDIVIIVRGKFDAIVSNRKQMALNKTTLWCKNEGLKINPIKTTIIPFTRRKKVSFPNIALDGTLLKFSSEVKYLGITLDKKLHWNIHLEQVIKKATNALWISKRTFGKKWGLKPKMIHWIYMSIVKPKILYASLVWWPKTNQKAAQKKLDKLQRLATISITGAMRSTPSKALEALLNFLPLDQFIQMDAMKNALRIRRIKELFEGDLNNHLSILREIHVSPLLLKNEDLMTKIHEFDHQFKVFNTTRNDWETGGPQIRPGSIIFYTDGSKQDDRVGAGITGPGINCALSMGKWPTVFQAEIFAILECVKICLKRRYRNANICIFSDSQAALNALKSMTYTSKIVWECYKELQQLSCRNMVNLYWVPGHCGIVGNEKADELAKLGSSQQFIGPEPFIGLSSASLKMEFKNWKKRKVESIWNATLTARQSKRFIKPNASNTQRLLDLSKKDLCTYTGLLTGHCPSKYHLKIIGKLSDDKCRFCNMESETSEHLLCDCFALYNKRVKVLGKGLTGPEEIWNHSPNKIVCFIRSAIPCWENAES